MLRFPYSMHSHEPWYGRIKPQIIARPLIQNNEGGSKLVDYKFHMFAQPDGPSKVICKIIDPENHWGAVVDENYERLPFEWNYEAHPPLQGAIPQVPTFFEMLADAYELSKDFDYVRVDFMVEGESYYFTELTFATAGGHASFAPESYNRAIGDWWHLDTGNALKRFIWKSRTWLPLWKTERPMRNLRRLDRDKKDWQLWAIKKEDYLLPEYHEPS
jgi:hypothetical protein